MFVISRKPNHFLKYACSDYSIINSTRLSSVQSAVCLNMTDAQKPELELPVGRKYDSHRVTVQNQNTLKCHEESSRTIRGGHRRFLAMIS